MLGAWPARPRRARIAFPDAAAKQLQNLSEAELQVLDRALIVLSIAHDATILIPGTPTGSRLRQYTGDIEPVRILYFVTALRTVVVGACIEV
ncbi:hypothetical protein [Streptomyces sp. SAI-041]|uniref:hypothetical protein n=1 Tax=Streptomyces sp. SAI-041 TaxID=2940548 RepID=UPI0024763EA6|nr:hypothetical protein [Streptomyces sp. SAI-041]MDH6553994.1 hypothetical protein [Streptomyces sp. SAI-041]